MSPFSCKLTVSFSTIQCKKVTIKRNNESPGPWKHISRFAGEVGNLRGETKALFFAPSAAILGNMNRIALSFLLLMWSLSSLHAFGCSSETNGCDTDSDCMTGFICVSKVCYQRKDDGWDAGDAGADPGSDPDTGSDTGSDHGLDDGGDPGSDPGSDQAGDPGADMPADNESFWSINPSVGIQAILVSQGVSSPHKLQESKLVLGEQGVALENAPFTLSFRNDTIWISGIDANDNQTFDDHDYVISVVANPGLNARTQEGLAVGDPRSSVLANPTYSSPDHTAILDPSGDFPGGKLDEYFTTGVFFGYDEQDKVNAITVTRSYRPPDAIIIPEEAKLTFGTDGSPFCGDGYTTGSKRDLHRGILGEPDMASVYQQEITLSDGTVITIDFFIDSYRIQGMEFIGGDDTYLWYDIDRTVSIILYPMFYGKTDGGNGIGTTRAMWQNEFGAPVDIKENTEYNTKTYIYQAGTRGIAVLYTNNGASFDDKATWIMLNVKLDGKGFSLAPEADLLPALASRNLMD